MKDSILIFVVEEDYSSYLSLICDPNNQCIKDKFMDFVITHCKHYVKSTSILPNGQELHYLWIGIIFPLYTLSDNMSPIIDPYKDINDFADQVKIKFEKYTNLKKFWEDYTIGLATPLEEKPLVSHPFV